MWSTPESARLFLAGLVERARGLKKSVVFPEGGDPRVLEAAARLAREGVLRPILIAPPPHPAIEGVAFVDAETSPLNRKYAALYYERRRSKGVTLADAEVIARKPLYFAALMLAAGDADGFVGGSRQHDRRNRPRRAPFGGVGPAREAGFECLHHGASG